MIIGMHGQEFTIHFRFQYFLPTSNNNSMQGYNVQDPSMNQQPQ